MYSHHRRWQLFGTGLALSLVIAGCSVTTIAENDDSTIDGDSAPVDSEDDPMVESTDDDASPITIQDSAANLPFVPFQAIVKFRASTQARARADLAASMQIEDLTPEMSVVRFDSGGGANRIAMDPVAETWARINELRARDDVEYAHPDWQFEFSAVPNDPLYPMQWHYPAVQLPAAWDLTTGSSTVRIAILDTGRNSHSDLANKWVSGIGYDAAGDGSSQADPGTAFQHGIHVASIAGGSTNNGSGSAGVCWGCQLLNVDVSFGDSAPQASAIIKGIDWAIKNRARVINMSFAGTGKPCSHPDMAAMYQAAESAAKANVTLVAAAGNAGQNAANAVPASCPGVIAVAATGPNNTLAEYSNRGAVTLAAPGGAAALVSKPYNGGTILDAAIDGAGIGCPNDLIFPPPNQNSFGASTQGVVANWTTSTGVHCNRYLSGTSMAAPHVAGVVGLMLSRNPSLTPTQIRNLLQASATPLPSCNGNCGAGLLNALGAVQQAAALPVNDPPPVAHFTVQCAGLQCTFNGSGSTDNSGIVSHEWILPGQQFDMGASVSRFMPGYNSASARLRVTDNRGQSTEITGIVTPAQPVITPVTGSYHNPDRPVHNIDLFETSDGSLVLFWYTYETNGEPVWYHSAAGPRSGARWTQPLYRATWNGASATLTPVGTVSLDFSSSSVAWFSWVLNGVAGGERFAYEFGGQGRSGSWYVPTQSGWGIQVQESGSTLRATVAFYVQGQPRWMRGTTSPASNVNIPLSYYKARWLCPSCSGTEQRTVDNDWILSSMNLQIANGSSLSGSASTDIRGLNYSPMWVRPLQSIQILTKP